MATASRIAATLGGRRLVLLLGVALLALAFATTHVLASRGEPPLSILIEFGLVGGPALVLVFGAHRLHRYDVDPAFYPTVAVWSYATVVVITAMMVLYDLKPTGGLANPISAVPPLLAVAAATGFAAGVHDARARTRQRALDRRNRELQDQNRQMELIQAELERTVDQLEASNERLEQFAYAVSHDLKEPLRTISSHLTLLDRDHGDDVDPDARESLDLVVDAADRMLAMVDGLLAYSRVETDAQPFEPVDLNEVVDEARADLQSRLAESDAELTVEELPTVEGDRDQLRQVFQNLLDNAVEYSGDAPPRIEIAADREDDWWTVAVSDRGVGMEPDETERIFEVFERLHGREDHEGTGVGLAICKRVVERHGGEIWVDAAPGEGSTFYLTLPAVDASDRARSNEHAASVD